MNDPISSLSAPPPRYLLESDSEDEEGQGSYPGVSRSTQKSKAEPINVEIKWSTSQKPITRVVVTIDQAGRYLRRKAALVQSSCNLSVVCDGEAIGKGWVVEEDLLVCMDHDESRSEVNWELSKSLLHSFKAESWTIVSIYLPSMYIPSPSENLSSQPPIRYISTDSSLSPYAGGIAKYDSPNYVTGLTASMISKATHSGSVAPFNVTALLLPLPLSSNPSSSLTSALNPLSTHLSSRLTRSSTQASARWSEDDDEPFSGPGMGGCRRVRAGGISSRKLKEDISTMYM